jgi:hypothetical protein
MAYLNVDIYRHCVSCPLGVAFQVSEEKPSGSLTDSGAIIISKYAELERTGVNSRTGLEQLRETR